MRTYTIIERGEWVFLHPKATCEHLGYIPEWLHLADPRPAKEQLDAAYRHGGGWDPFKGFEMPDKTTGVMRYPGDPPQKPIAKCQFRDELIFMYNHGWVSIVQKDGTWEVARMD